MSLLDPPVTAGSIARVVSVASSDDAAKLSAQFGKLGTYLPSNYADFPLSVGQRYGQVATNCRVLNAKSSNNMGFCARAHHKAVGAITDIAVKLANWWVDRSFAGTKLETPNNASATYGATLEFPAGTFTRFKFNGDARYNVRGGSELVSDFIPIAIPDGSEFWVNVWQWSGDTITFFNGGTGCVTANGEKNVSGSSTAPSADYTTTVGGGTMATQTFNYWPLALIGRTTNKAVGILGDSICEGVGDTVDTSDGVGIVARSLGASFGFINFGQSGDRLEIAVQSSTRRMANLAYVKNAVCNWGVNDIGNGRTLAQIKADMITAWTAAGLKLPSGGRVFQTTITPETTSSDSWATLVNQTAVANFSTGGAGTRELLNDWLRDGAPMSGGAAVAIGTVGALRCGTAGHPLYAVFEVADQVESARNSGKWKVDGTANKWTADGIHPTQFGYLQVAASGAITTASFV